MTKNYLLYRNVSRAQFCKTDVSRSSKLAAAERQASDWKTYRKTEREKYQEMKDVKVRIE